MEECALGVSIGGAPALESFNAELNMMKSLVGVVCIRGVPGSKIARR